jgi:uncharacterized membrane protein YhaH (DUF805 family)
LAKILASIGRGFGGVLRFSGRDAPGQFWPYALFLVFLNAVIAVAVIVPTIFASIARMQRFAAEHPELTTVRSGPGHYSIEIRGNHPELMPDIGSIAILLAALAALTAALLAAAVARRLHDRDRRGWWGAMPLPFLIYALTVMPPVFAAIQGGRPPKLGLFFSLFLNNLFYLASLGVLIVLLVGSGTRGPNRFGDPPLP